MREIHQQILDVFNFRHATKQFDPSRKVSDDDFALILEAARLSPSSFGFEPWKFLVVQKPELRQKLMPLAWGAQKSLQAADRFVIILARKAVDTRHDADYVQKIMKEVHHLPDDAIRQRTDKYARFQQKDFDLLADERYLFDWAGKQTYIALANMLTVAAFLGIDSCPIEGFDRQAVDDLLSSEGLMDAEHFSVSVMASFGFRAAQPRGKTRQNPDQVIQWL